MSPICPELLGELLKDYQKSEDLLGDNGLLRQLNKSLGRAQRREAGLRHCVGLSSKEL